MVERKTVKAKCPKSGAGNQAFQDRRNAGFQLFPELKQSQPAKAKESLPNKRSKGLKDQSK